MTTCMPLFEIRRKGDTMVVSPAADLGELDSLSIEAAARGVLRLWHSLPVRNVVLDFRRTDYVSSTALGLLAGLWKAVRHRRGRMVLCNVSEHLREILTVCGLDRLWPAYPSDEAALTAVNE
jgi:anti-anti-sigma factor